MTLFKFVGSSIYKQRSKTIRWELSYGEFGACHRTFQKIMYLKQTWNQSPIWVSSTSSKYLELSYIVVQSWWNLSSLIHKKKYIYLLQGQQLRSGVVETCISHQFSRENLLWRKKSFFCFWPLKSAFCYSRLNTKHKSLKNPKSNAPHTQPKPQAAKSISKKISNNMRSSFFEGSKFTNQNSL